jgi:hypothetical protein
LRSSDIEEDRGLVGEHLLFDADNGSVHWVVDAGQVGLGGTLSHSAEFVVDRSMAQADPSLVSSQIGHRDASQVSANSWTHQDLRVSSVREGSNRDLVKGSGVWKGPRLSYLRESQSSNENKLSVPRCLEHFSRRKLRHIELLVRVSDVSGPGDHLLVEASDDCLNSKNVAAEHESLKHVNLGSLQIVILVLFVPESVLIEPVVDLGPRVEGVSEVGRSWWGDPELVFLVDLEVVDELLVLSLIVLLDDSEVPLVLA